MIVLFTMDNVLCPYFLAFCLEMLVLFVTRFMTGHKNALIVKWNVTTGSALYVAPLRHTYGKPVSFLRTDGRRRKRKEKKRIGAVAIGGTTAYRSQKQNVNDPISTHPSLCRAACRTQRVVSSRTVNLRWDRTKKKNNRKRKGTLN